LTKAPIDLRTLTALVAVADEGSFRGAARTLGYTQSAISHQIATIERRLGITLFERPGGRGQISLTPLGELAYQHAQRVIVASEALDADVTAALAGERGTVRIGISQSSCYVLAQPLAQLRRHTPGIEISLINCATAETLAQQLHRGQLDVGLYVNIEPDERVVTIPLFDDAWMIIAHRDDPIAHSSSVTLDALDGAEMIAWHSRWRSQASLEQLWRRRRIRPRIVYRTDDSFMIQTLVATGLGRACLGALSVQELSDPRLRRISIRDEVPARTLSLCYAREREPTPAAVVLIDAIRGISSPAHVATAVASLRRSDADVAAA
jgi:DNA-binding transcriptional LysR family regulator